MSYVVGYSVASASPLYPLTLELEIVARSSVGTTSIFGLDSMEYPITAVISAIPNISVNWYIRNWNNSQVGSVSVFLSVWGTFIITSGSSVTAVRENIELRII